MVTSHTATKLKEEGIRLTFKTSSLAMCTLGRCMFSLCSTDWLMIFLAPVYQ